MMSPRQLVYLLLPVMAAVCLVGCSSNKMAKIEDSNAFVWQKYMNEEEFEKLEEGMSYIEVVEIARGRGEQIDENTFIWKDEQLMTQAYEVYFEEEKLVDKRIIEKRGHSIRDLVEQ